MIVAEEVVVSPKCQRVVSVKMQYGNLITKAPAWMTEIQPEERNVDTTQVRVVNLNEDPVKLIKDQVLGSLHPVEVGHSGVSDVG